MEYKDFLISKQITDKPSGFNVEIDDLNENLFDWQKLIVKWSLMRGRSAIFATCGLGKTIMQLEFANQIYLKENKPVLILAPLSVSEQSVREGIKFGISINLCKSQKDVIDGVNITNYERLHLFDANKFIGVIIDESGILKNFASATRNAIISSFHSTRYKLACTAVPAPNDFPELGNTCEFLGIMSRSEMLATFLINDTKNTGSSNWRLKGHVKDNIFWKWVASFSVMIQKPSDIGFSDDGFILPKINYHEHVIKSDIKPKYGLFIDCAQTLNERRQVRKMTINARCQLAADIINATDDIWLAWCGLNDEGVTLTKMINGAEEVAGRHSDEIKISRIANFADGKIKRLVSKVKIAGFGLNFQVCHKAIFVGMSDSFEGFFQSVRRIWRFGQTEEVDIHIIIEEREKNVLKNIQRKEKQFKQMTSGMVVHMKGIVRQNLKQAAREKEEYNPNIKMVLPQWI